jgi:cyanophycinase
MRANKTIGAVLASTFGFLACSSPPSGSFDASVTDAAPPDAFAPPTPPAALVRWIVGDPADRITPSRRGVLLMGGGTDVDTAFTWQRERIGGGDIVVLRTTGADGYNAYLYGDIGGADSVETMIVSSRALASDPYVVWTLDHAEAVFLAGGDQATYVAAWDDSPVADALARAFTRGAVIGGTSAGCAFLAGTVYAATSGSVLSDEALADPYDSRVTLVRDVVSLAPMTDVVTDTHFGARDRMGRLLAFAARTIVDGWTQHPIAIGVDERTALVVDEAGAGRVVGTGSVYVIAPMAAPARCTSGQTLDWQDVRLYELTAGDTISLPGGTTSVTPRTVSSVDGVMVPANPY